MGLYLEMIRLSFLREYIYKGNTYITILRNFLYLFISVSIWRSLYAGSEAVNGILLSDMVSYLVIGLLVRNITRSNISYIIADKVRSGEIVTDLIKPLSLNASIFSQQIGKNMFSLLFSTIPVCVIGVLIYDFHLAKDLVTFLLFLISMLLGIILMYYIDYVLGLLSFWLKNGLYIEFFLGAAFEIFSGSVVPLWFYPEPLKNVCMLLPFHLVAFEPISIYLGKHTLGSALQLIGLQLLWIALFVALAKLIWHKAQSVITIQGG